MMLFMASLMIQLFLPPDSAFDILLRVQLVLILLTAEPRAILQRLSRNLRQLHLSNDKVVFQSLASSTFGLHGFLMFNRIQGGAD